MSFKLHINSSVQKEVTSLVALTADFTECLISSSAFLVRDSSVSGGYVISYVFNGRTFHAQVLPETNPDLGHVYYSLDDGKTKFFDLLQVVEFYQLNRGSLNTKLTHLIVREETPSGPVKAVVATSGAGNVASKETEGSGGEGALQKSESSYVR